MAKKKETTMVVENIKGSDPKLFIDGAEFKGVRSISINQNAGQDSPVARVLIDVPVVTSDD